MFRQFNTELVCAQFIENMRWKGTPLCPHCGSEHFYRVKTRLKHPELAGYKDFLCKACAKKYSVLTGTVMEGSKVSLKGWVYAIYMLVGHKKGVSSMQLARDIGVSQPTAWFMLHRIREMVREREPELLEGVIMVDETFVGGKNKNRHKHKKVRNSQGRSFKDKTPVLGLLQQGGKLRCFAIKDTSAANIQPLLRRHVRKGSAIYSDEWAAYKGISDEYEHLVVDHSRGQYKSGECCTNAIEGAWSHLKRTIIGTYHFTSRRHLQAYCNEFVFRYNNRDVSDVRKMELAIENSNDTRVLHKVLTATIKSTKK